MNLTFFFPPTTTKVNRNTSADINERIRKKTEDNIKDLYGKDNKDIISRIKELDYEWDTERVLEINFAGVVLITSILALTGKKGWIVLAGVASCFMIQHSIQGWCPPLPFIRKLGIRTATEIYNEKMVLITMMENSAAKKEKEM
jgi:hypothetical protein